MTTVMTTGDLYIAVKKADPMSYLMGRFGFSDESELFSTILKVAPSKGAGFIKTLKKKQKKLNQRARVTSENSDETVDQSEESADETIEQEVDIILEGDESTDEKNESNQASTSEIPNLEQLMGQERNISSEICKIEVEHKDLVTKRRNLILELQKRQNALRELQRLLQVQEDNVTRTYEEYLECASQMEALNREKKSYMKQLDSIRLQIDEMRKVNIFVYENASFEVENIPIEPIADSQITSQSIKLFALPEAEELTAKEIKNIAKLQLVVDLIENNNYKAELVFDSARVQKFWETVVAQN